MTEKERLEAVERMLQERYRDVDLTGLEFSPECGLHRCYRGWPAECSSGADGWEDSPGKRKCFRLVEIQRALAKL